MEAAPAPREHRIRRLLSSRWVGWAVLAAGLGGASLLLSRQPNAFEPISRLGLADLAALLAVNIFNFGITATVSWQQLHALDCGVPWRINLALGFLGNFLNYFGPAQPGMGAKALYLKLARNVRYTDFVIVAGTNALLMILLSGLYGGAIVAWFWLSEGRKLAELGLLSLGMVASVIGMPLFWPVLRRFRRSGNRVFQALGNAIEGAGTLWAKRRTMATTLGLLTIQYLAAGLGVQLSYQAVGVDPGFLVALLIACFLSVANILPLTPNNIGVAELVMGTATQLTGADFASGLLAGGVMRAFHISISVLAFPYASWQIRNAPARGEASTIRTEQ